MLILWYARDKSSRPDYDNAEQSLTISYAKALLREICPPRKGCRAAPWLLKEACRRLDQPKSLLLSLSGGLPCPSSRTCLDKLQQ